MEARISAIKVPCPLFPACPGRDAVSTIPKIPCPEEFCWPARFTVIPAPPPGVNDKPPTPTLPLVPKVKVTSAAPLAVIHSVMDERLKKLGSLVLILSAVYPVPGVKAAALDPSSCTQPQRRSPLRPKVVPVFTPSVVVGGLLCTTTVPPLFVAVDTPVLVNSLTSICRSAMDDAMFCTTVLTPPG